MTDKLTVLVLRNFAKLGKGEEVRGKIGETIEVSPELAEFLTGRNLVEIVFDDNEE